MLLIGVQLDLAVLLLCTAPVHGAEFMRKQILIDALLERERGIQVSAHQTVLDFGGFGQHRDQLIAVGCRLQEILHG